MAQTESIEILVPGETLTMPAYVATPAAAGGPRPAVLVLEEIFGVNSHIRSVVDRVAQLGYVAIAPDYHYRNARGQELGYTAADVQKGMAVIGHLVATELVRDLEATVAYLKTRGDVDPDRLGAIGFCIGGHAAYLAAATLPLRATASFYGGGIASMGLGEAAPTVARTPQIGGTIVCFFGGQDHAIPLTQVAQIEAALTAAGTRHEVIVYDHANHGFFCDQRGSYDATAAAAAWQRVTALFATELDRAT